MHTNELIINSMSYSEYQKQIKETLASPPPNPVAEGTSPYLANNAVLMDDLDRSPKLIVLDQGLSR